MMSSNGFGPVTGGAHETGRLHDDQASTVTVPAIAGVVPRRPLPLDAYTGHARTVTALRFDR